MVNDNWDWGYSVVSCKRGPTTVSTCAACSLGRTGIDGRWTNGSTGRQTRRRTTGMVPGCASSADQVWRRYCRFLHCGSTVERSPFTKAIQQQRLMFMHSQTQTRYAIKNIYILLPRWLASLTACLISSTRWFVTMVGSLLCGWFRSLKSPELSRDEDISLLPSLRSRSANTCFNCSANDAGGPDRPVDDSTGLDRTIRILRTLESYLFAKVANFVPS